MAPAGFAVTFQLGTGKKGKGVDDKGARLLNQPRGLKVCADGALLVADYFNNCVLRFKPGDSKGKIVAGEEGKALPVIDPMKDLDKKNPGPLTLPEEEGVLLRQPCDVCEDPASPGTFLVLDTDEGSVQRFGGGARAATLVPHGGKTTCRSIGSPETVKNPRSFAIAPDGAIIVCDTWSHRILRYPPPDGPDAASQPTVLAGVPNSWGNTPSKLAFPSGVAFAADGALLVADTNNHRVQRFAPGEAEGTTVAGSAQGRRGSGLNELDMPTGLCVDPRDGSLLVADRSNARVLRFPSDSRSETHGVVLAGSEVLQNPWGVAAAPGGAVYVSDERQGAVFRFEEGAAAAVPVAPPAPAPKEAPEPPAAPAPQLGAMDLD